MQCRLYGFGHDEVAAYIRTFFESSLAVRSFDIAYRGEPSGYIGEFQIVDAEGGFAVQHTAFRMA
ncbi:MAG TPA: hypothetical protein VGI10_20600 [Polyangiaceae bacterium]|jgi:hypothetical protein